MKKIISFFLVCFMLLSLCSVSSFADSNITVNLNGKNIDFDTMPLIIQDTTMVPIRAVAEAFGCNVDWDEETYTVAITKGDTKLSLTLGGNYIMKNDLKINLTVPATEIDGRIVVPIRAIAEAFGCNVDWNDENQQVIITTNEQIENIINAFTSKDENGNNLINSIGIEPKTAVANLKASLDNALNSYITNKITNSDIEDFYDELNKSLENLNIAIENVSDPDLKLKLQTLSDTVSDLLNNYKTQSATKVIANINSIISQINALTK